jgi:hypothetical protein
MGEFTQNLLKLTEFPFSYSLIGLLALITGQGVNLDELSFDKIGPILILIGFVATTLSICDPIGAFQRRIIKWKKLPFRKYKSAKKYMGARVFGKTITPDIFPSPYLFAIGYSPEGIKKRYPIDWVPVELYFAEGREFSRTKSTAKDYPLSLKYYQQDRRPRYLRHSKPALIIGYIGFLIVRGPLAINDSIRRKIKHISKEQVAKEMQEEVYRLHLLAELVGRVQTQLKHFSKSDVEDMGELLERLKERTVKTKWITAEVDRITALFYFIIIISLFIYAIEIYQDLLPKFTKFFGDVELTKLTIIGLSVAGLGAVVYVLKLRIFGLRTRALTVFKYLTALGAIKTSKENFKTTLQDIERYLNEDHWPLAEYWVNRVQIDYSELFLKEVKKPTGVTKKPTGVTKKPTGVG